MTTAVTLDLDRILAGGQLPALPQSAISLLQLSKDPNNGPTEYAIPIETDAGLTCQVLKFVNSSYFGFSREISSVKLAITLVGVRTVKNFALWSAVFSLMPNPKCGPFDLKGLWQDSLRRGLFARAAARLLAQNRPNPFRDVTRIAYVLETSGPVRLNLYDVTGRLVRRLVDGVELAGSHEVTLGADNLPAGTYWYRLEFAGRTESRKALRIN